MDPKTSVELGHPSSSSPTSEPATSRTTPYQIVLLLCETWLGFALWTLTELMLFEFDDEYDFVQGNNDRQKKLLGILLAYFLVTVVFILLPACQKIAAHFTHELRVVGSFGFWVLNLPADTAECYVVSFAAVLFWIAWVGTLFAPTPKTEMESKFIEPFFHKFKLSVEPLTSNEYDRYVAGCILGGMLMICLKQFDTSLNPVWSHVTTQVIFGFITMGCATFLFLVRRKHPRFKKFFDKEDKPREFLRQPIQVEACAWFFDGISIGSVGFMLLMLFTSGDILPRWVGWAPFPWNFPVATLLCVGIFISPFLPNSPLWYPATVLGGALLATEINAGGYIGGLLIALCIPVAFLQTMKELPYCSRLMPLTLVVAVGAFLGVGLAGYAGTIRGAQQGHYGRLFIRARQNFIMPIVVGMGVFLIPKTMRLWTSLSKDEEGNQKTYKAILKEISEEYFSVDWTADQTCSTVAAAIFGLWIIAFTVRGVRESQTVSEPNANTLNIASWNIMQGRSRYSCSWTARK